MHRATPAAEDRFTAWPTGPHVQRLNRDLLQLRSSEKPDILWADKLLWMQPATLDRLRALGIVTVSYMIDNPFGPRQDPGWRLYMKDIPHYDLHVVQRDENIADYTCTWRARRDQDPDRLRAHHPLSPAAPAGPTQIVTARSRSSARPTMTAPTTLTRLDRLGESDVRDLRQRALLATRALSPEASARHLSRGRALRAAIPRGASGTRRSISAFITRSNQDEFVHKSFEIAGCGGFLLAERSDGPSRRVQRRRRSCLLRRLGRAAAKIRRYLPDEAARTRIAAAGHARAVRDGYDNDTRSA